MPNTTLDRNSGIRRTGALQLFLAPDNESVLTNPHSRFKVCRGFIDDLNRILPIRLRIQLEEEIFRGAQAGGFQAGQVRYRWEFHAA